MSTVARATDYIRDVQIVEERYRLLQSITGLVTVEETVLAIETSLICQFQITATRCWYTGQVIELSVTPVPAPPPRHSRRGFWWQWVN